MHGVYEVLHKMRAVQAELFEETPQPTPRRPLSFSPFGAAKKRRFARATKLARIPRQTDIGPAIYGSELLGLPLTRQGEEIAAVLEAKDKKGFPLYDEIVILVPRRSAKTTSIWADILGRCIARPGTLVATTAQDGIRARSIFRDKQRALVAADFEGLKNPLARLGKLRWANGDEAIEFDNGSRIWVVPPEASAFRSEAADILLFDEAGELSEARSEDLVTGALPLMDTRPYSQVIIAGTPSKERAGLLWDKAQEAQAPRSKIGAVIYALSDHESPWLFDEDGVRTLNSDVVRHVHPGIGSLTTFAKIEKRASQLKPDKFEREYLCRFPFDSASSAIKESDWKAGKAEGDMPARPDRVGLGFDVAPDGSASALVAAWRDEDGRAMIELLAYDWGTDKLPAKAKQAARRYRVAVGYDSIGANEDPAAVMKKNRTNVQPLFLKHMYGASARIAREIERHNITHWDQDDLTAAALGATWRNTGDSGRLFARKASAADVCPLVAAAIALWQYDQQAKARRRSITSTERNAAA